MLSLWLYLCGGVLFYIIIDRFQKDSVEKRSAPLVKCAKCACVMWWPLFATLYAMSQMFGWNPKREPTLSRGDALDELRALRIRLLRGDVSDQAACANDVLSPAIAALEGETECAECGAAVQPCVRDYVAKGGG